MGLIITILFLLIFWALLKIKIIKKIFNFFALGLFLLICTMLLLNTIFGRKRGDIKVYDFKYERLEFFKGTVALQLPNNPRHEMTAYYYKVLMDQALCWEAGNFEISVVDITRYEGPRKEKFEDEFKNKLEIVVWKDIDENTIDRMAFWYGENSFALDTHTWWSEGMFSTPADCDTRIKKDDEIFEHIIQSFRYRRDDGTYAKPEIVYKPDEIRGTRIRNNNLKNLTG